MLRRAEASGCEAIVVTLDTTLLGWRTRDLDLAYLPFLRGMGIAQYTSDPVFRASLDQPLPDAGPEVKPAVEASSCCAPAPKPAQASACCPPAAEPKQKCC